MSYAPVCNLRPCGCIQLARVQKVLARPCCPYQRVKSPTVRRNIGSQMSDANWIVDGFSVPDIMLPSQHFDSGTKHLGPEKQLMLG